MPHRTSGALSRVSCVTNGGASRVNHMTGPQLFYKVYRKNMGNGKERKWGKKDKILKTRNPTDPTLKTSPTPCQLYEFGPPLHMENGSKNTSLTLPPRAVMKVK